VTRAQHLEILKAVRLESVEKLLSISLGISASFVDPGRLSEYTALPSTNTDILPSIYRDLLEIGAVGSNFVTSMVG
jgi:hypothetical protein